MMNLCTVSIKKTILMEFPWERAWGEVMNRKLGVDKAHPSEIDN